MFQTDMHYTDRQSKAEYVWRKYQPLLKGASILDVGADECHLRNHLDPQATYVGVGLGGNPDQQVDLEVEPLPFEDNSFDCALCLDVLEHLDNVHATFDELCRVARRHVIICLPNPWTEFWGMLVAREYRPGQATKFYGLPSQRPEDRHKWFFSAAEAEAFIRERSAQAGMSVVQIDQEGEERRLSLKLRLLKRLMFRRDLDLRQLMLGPTWAVLEKPDAG